MRYSHTKLFEHVEKHLLRMGSIAYREMEVNLETSSERTHKLGWIDDEFRMVVTFPKKLGSLADCVIKFVW